MIVRDEQRSDVQPPRPVPAELLDALRENAPEFAATLDHRGGRPHWSASEWDMSIASQLKRAGFDDQTTADLIAWHRLHHDSRDGKATRIDYLERTIARADGAAYQPGRADDAVIAPDWPPGWTSDRPPLAVVEDYVRRTIARARGADLPDLDDDQEADVDACFQLIGAEQGA